MYYRARMCNLDIIDISYPLLHLEHKKQKEDNLLESERKIAFQYRKFKATYLNHIVENNLYKNPEEIAKNVPCIKLFNEFKYLNL
jgi:hypothetical protein